MANIEGDADFREKNGGLVLATLENREISSQLKSSSFNEQKMQQRNSHLALRKSKSWSCSPRPCNGIPLGSLTAQAAAKPFWGKDMLQERIQEIAELAALETSSLGSSIEDNISTAELEDLEECEEIPTFNISKEDELVSSSSTPAVPRHADSPSPVALRSQSAQQIQRGGPVEAVGKKKEMSISAPSSRSEARTKSATSRLTHCNDKMASLSVEGKKIELSLRFSSPSRDDGFHEK